MRRYAVLAMLVCLFCAPARGLNGGTTYPKLACYTSGTGGASSATLDSLARFDTLIHLWAPRPEAAAALWARNPDLRILLEIQPQYVPLCDTSHPWWLADTLRNPTRAMQWACFKNPGWLMRDTAGRLIGPLGGNDYLVNWTAYCPRGTYGSTKGLRAAQWYPRMLAEVCLSGRGWPRMGWDRKGTPAGVVFEIFGDCLGSYGHLDVLSRADPDRDGVAEGVSHTCSAGGSADPLSVLMRQENMAFWSGLRALFPPEFVFLINENTKWIGPAWRTGLSAMKFENGNWDQDWYGWWYGKTTGRGYRWAEEMMGRSPAVPDRLRGWDLSIVCLTYRPDLSDAENARRRRLVMGTCALGDGYFYWNPGNERSPAWPAEFNRDLGVPLGDAYPLVAIGPDTLYARRFTGGTVRVNPSGRRLLNVPPKDAVIR